MNSIDATRDALVRIISASERRRAILDELARLDECEETARTKYLTAIDAITLKRKTLRKEYDELLGGDCSGQSARD